MKPDALLDLESFQRQAPQERKTHQAIAKKLRKVQGKTLDAAFHTAHQAVFEEIDCLNCGHCCRTVGPLFLEADIDRLAKHLKMKPAEFMQDYLRRDEDGHWVLQSLPCPFLGADNYCSVYEVRPKACRSYPHTNHRKMHQHLNLAARNAEHCPAVYRILRVVYDQV